MKKIKCCVETCDKYRNGFDKYCSMHRARLHRTGRLILISPIERILKRVEIDSNNCWNFIGATNGKGYGRVRIYDIKYGVHRVIWEHLNGKIPEGMLVLHKCDNRLCFNPSHLFLGTYKDNMQDCIKKGRFKGFKKGCSPKKKGK
jgi:hypothetical protein